MNFYSKSANNTNLAINFHPFASDTDTINISIFSRSSSGNIPGKYEIIRKFVNSVELMQGFVLADYYTNTFVDLRDFDVYPFEINSDAASAGNNRFKLLTNKDAISQSVPKDELTQMLVYPNPGQDQIHVQFSNSLNTDKVSLSIIDIKGSVVHTDVLEVINDQITLNISGLVNGMYMINVVDNDGQVHTQKLIKR